MSITAVQQNTKRYLVRPLGGLGEVGRNMMAVEYRDAIIVVDAGLTFPDEEMLGIDIVIPDMSFLVENSHKVKAVVLTHGHEDHIGATPYFVRQFPAVPLFGTPFTLGLVKRKLSEHGLQLAPGSRTISAGERFQVGPFTVRPFRVNHAIPDAVGFAISTDLGTLVFTGDFKFDQTPVDGLVANYDILGQLREEGVLALFSDSTNAERPGYTPSERVVGQSLERIIKQASGRVFVATFASNVPRVQQIFNVAARHGRKVAVAGRSLENAVELGLELGYLKLPGDVYVTLDQASKLKPDQVVIVTTGSQGEPMSALARLSTADFRAFEILPGDTVVIAATPIPGNEKAVYRIVDNLYKLGAEVIYGSEAGVHVSGHGSQEEQKLMINLVRPKFFIPVHGEYRMLMRHAKLAEACGIASENIMIGENGVVFEITADHARISGTFTAGKILVDGLGVGDVGHIVLRDRRQLAEDGILIVVVAIDRQTGVLVAGPDIVSRGFVYVRESEALLEESKQRAAHALAKRESPSRAEWGTIKTVVRDAIGSHLYEKTRRRPMILPIVLEV